MKRRIALFACAMLLSLSMAVPALANVQLSDSANNVITASSRELPQEEQTEDAEPADPEPQESSSSSDDKTTCLLVIVVLCGSVLVLGPLVHRGRTNGQGTVSDK